MRIVICILSILTLTASPLGYLRASDIESLLMPGKVITGHAKYETECTKCHQLFSKLSENERCMDCHEKVAEDINNKKGFHGLDTMAIQAECRQCHTDHLGRNADIIGLNKISFDHDITDFQLKGKHKNTICNLCHLPEKKFREAPSVCYDCHKDNDPHKGKLGKKCNDCHKEDGWEKTKFDHDKTDFPLKGKHKDTRCVSCHLSQLYENTPTQCYSCHLLDNVHGKTHEKKCNTCHNPKEWDSIKFDHDKTDFLLKGKHKDTGCKSCHEDNYFKDEPDKTCYSCHKNDDSHKGRNGTKCKDCHSPKQWDLVSFKHDKDTKFPLKGKHKKIDCISCHKGTIGKDKLKKTVSPATGRMTCTRIRKNQNVANVTMSKDGVTIFSLIMILQNFLWSDSMHPRHVRNATSHRSTRTLNQTVIHAMKRKMFTKNNCQLSVSSAITQIAGYSGILITTMKLNLS